jgi:hypothetical protein
MAVTANSTTQTRLAGGAGLAVALLLASCASSVEKVTEGTGPLQFQGYSIAPPSGPGWEMLRTADVAMFGKGTASGSHTFAATVVRHRNLDPASVGYADYWSNPEVFAAYVKEAGERANPPGSRNRIIQHDVVADARFGYCAREYLKSEDSGSPLAPQVLVQEDWGYSCLHPEDSRSIVQVVFSERGLPGESDPAAAEVREAFFAGFEFARPAPAAAAPAVGSPPVAAPTVDVLFVVKESLRDGVRKAAAASTPPFSFDFADVPQPGQGTRTIVLVFNSTVDESSQKSNQGGAVIGGLVTMLFSAVTPWPCPVTHDLDARVLDAAGNQTANYRVTKKEKKIGTMIACREVKEPDEKIAADLVRDLLQNIAAPD